MTDDQYPDDGELYNDADALAKVIAGIMRNFGTDPNMIAATDAWEKYVAMWKFGVVTSGQTMPANWEAMVSGDSPLRRQFLICWERNKRLNSLITGITTPGPAPWRN